MKKIILIILTLLLIPFFILTIKDIDRKEVNPTLTYNLTTTDSTYTDLNEHTLQEVFEEGQLLLNNTFSVDSNSDGLADNWSKRSVTSATIVDGRQVITNTPDLDYIYLLQSFNSVVGNVYYARIGYISSIANPSSGSLQLQFGGVNSTILKNTIQNNISFKITTTNVSEYAILLSVTNGYTNANIVLDNLYLYNLTSLGISSLTVGEMDAWYTIYQTYHTTYTTLTLGTTTSTTYTSLQQLILDNDDKDFKLYRDDVVDETHYRLTQESGYISITNDDDLEIMRINADDTFESSLQVDDTVDYKLVGYNVTSYIDGSFDNTILAFVWIIPILLIGGFFFVIFSHRKED